MVVVFKTHENRQIAVHTRGIQHREGVFYPELRVKGLNCVRSWGSLSQVRTPARQPIVCLSGKWRTRLTKTTIAICSPKHKGVRRRQVVLKGRYSPPAAVMSANYGEGRGKMGGEGERDVLKEKKAFIKGAAGIRKTVLSVCVCLGFQEN